MQSDLISLFQSLKIESYEPGELRKSLERIATAAQRYFSADFCVIFPVNPVTHKFLREPPTIIGSLAKLTQKEFKIPRETGLASLVLTQKILLVEEGEISNYKTPITEIEKIHALVGFGLFTKRHARPLAVIYLDYKKPKKFDKKFQSELKTFIEIASSELQNTWFIRRYREIAKIGQDINENLESIDRVFEKVFTGIRGILDVGYYFSLAMYNLHRNDADLFLVEEGKKVAKKQNYPLTNSISSWMITNLVTLKIDNIDVDVLPEGVRAIHVEGTKSKEKSLVFVPLRISDRPLGVISVQHPEPSHYDDEDRQILELLANHISLAINNIRLLDDLRKVDAAGQILTQKLDSDQDVISEVVHLIHESTQADLVILYPYNQSEAKYLTPVFKGTFLNQDSLKMAQPDSAALVHLINLREEPAFANSSIAFYEFFGLNYSTQKFPVRENIQSMAAIPLKVGAESVGILFVNFRNRQIFHDAQKWTISSLARYAAIAIKNSRQYQRLRDRRLQELEHLRQIDREISQTLDRDKILQTILELTTKHIKADTGVILLHDKKLNAIKAKAAIGENLRPLEQQVYSLDQFKGIAKEAFKRKMTIRIENVRTSLEWKDMFNEISSNTISEMDVPLVLGDEVIGVMNFESSRISAFSVDDQEFMETLAGQAVIAIKNAIEYERAQRIAKERQALIDIVNTLLLQTEPKEIFSIILNKALELTETDKGTINTCDEIRREIKVVVDRGLKPEMKGGVQSFDKGIIGKSVREKHIIKIDRISSDPLSNEFYDAFPGIEESELAVPIFDGAKVIGVINLESENPYHFEDDDTELIRSLASLCAVAIKNAENMNQKQLASVGIITGDLSHKMKSPLSKIKSQIELIEMNCQDDLEKNSYLSEKLSQITTITSNTIQMVQNRLGEAKRNFTSVEMTSVPLMLKKALAEVEVPAEIELINSISNVTEPLNVLATPELANVFQNLLTNAVRAIASGRGRIYIYRERIDVNWVIISVEDTGIGIAENIAPLVFLPISDKGSEGHGFGLSMTRAYLEMIGGKIDDPVKSRDGVGAKFTIHLRKV
ncbi:MAG: GAF domain-containing protein [Anaerolineales bacterium]|nr:GAF domain-containing protein [Anaerolineales bacterium]